VLWVSRWFGWQCVRPLSLWERGSTRERGATCRELLAGRSDKKKGSRSGSLSHGYGVVM